MKVNLEYYLKNKEKLNEKYEFFIIKNQLMKIDFSQNLIDAHIDKAEHNLKLLINLNSEFNDWKIISLYYALYHSCLALLAKKNYVSKNHTATLIFILKNYTQIEANDISLIDELQLKEEDAKFYTFLKQERHNANYSTTTFYNNDNIEYFRKKTIKFLNKVKIILQTK